MKPLQRSSQGRATHRLVIVFGDQLDLNAAFIRSMSPDDTVLMMEVATELRHAHRHMQRIALLLSAMRHFAAELIQRGIRLRYVTLDDLESTGAFDTVIARAVAALKPCHIACTHPGEWRVLTMLERIRDSTPIPIVILPDEHYLAIPEALAAWVKDRTALTMEFFYREGLGAIAGLGFFLLRRFPPRRSPARGHRTPTRLRPAVPHRCRRCDRAALVIPTTVQRSPHRRPV